MADVAAARDEGRRRTRPRSSTRRAWRDHPRFIEAMADRARSALAAIEPAAPGRRAARLHRAQRPGGDGGGLALRGPARDGGRAPSSPSARPVRRVVGRLPEPQRLAARSVARARRRRRRSAALARRRRARRRGRRRSASSAITSRCSTTSTSRRRRWRECCRHRLPSRAPPPTITRRSSRCWPTWSGAGRRREARSSSAAASPGSRPRTGRWSWRASAAGHSS